MAGLVASLATTPAQATEITETIVIDGPSKTLNITTAGDTGRLTFEVSAAQVNQRVFLRWSYSGYGTFSQVRLLNPNTEVANTRVDSGYLETKTLTVAGTWSILFQPDGLGPSSSITFTLMSVPADNEGTIVPDGAAVTATVAVGQNPYFTFQGSQGQRVFLNATSSTISSWSTISIRDSGGRVIGDLHALVVGSFVDTVTLPGPDTYRAVIDGEGATSGSIVLRLYNVPADRVGTISSGSGVAVSNAVGQNPYLEFTGCLGQTFTLWATNRTGLSGNGTFAIRNGDGGGIPNGTLSLSLAPENPITVAAPSSPSGTYRAQVDPYGAEAGSVTLTVSVSGVCLPIEYSYGDWPLFANDPSAVISDPVDTLTGSFTAREVDLAMPETIGVPFEFVRYYASVDTADGRLGPGWRDAFSAWLQFGGTSDVRLHGENLQQVLYKHNPDGSYSAPGATARLTLLPSGEYDLVRRDQVHYRFDGGGQLLSIVDRNGKGLTLSYDGFGRLASVTDAVGRVFTLSYDDATDELTSVASPDGRHVDYGYTNRQLTSVTDARGQVWRYSYDTAGRLLSELDPNSHYLVRNTYDASSGRVTQQRDALDNLTSFAWNASTQTATITDPANRVWKDVYAGNALVQRVDPLNNSTRFGWETAGNVATITDARNNTTTLSYDSAGNLRTRAAPAPLSYQESWTYDSFNDVKSYTDGRGGTTSHDYDPGGNLTTATGPDPDGAGPLAAPVTQLGRQPGTGLVTSVTDPRNKTTSFGYDTLGRLTSVTTQLANKTTLAYDNAGRVTTVTEPRGNVTGCGCAAQYTSSYDYDAVGHLLLRTDALGTKTRFDYDAVGNLKTVTRALGTAREQTWNYDYNAANERTRQTAPDGSTVQAEYGGRGNLVKVISALNRITTYGYDAAGRPAAQTTPRGNMAGADRAAFTYAYSYNPTGDLAQITDPQGHTTTYAYDGIGRITSATLTDAATSATRTTSYTYDPDNNLKTLTGPDPDGPGPLGQGSSYVYDALDQLTSETDERRKVWAYTYDAAGNRASRRTPLGNTTTYGYDDDGRLASIVDPRGNAAGADPNLYRTSYRYDEAGSLTSVTDPLNHATTFAYDRAGRRTSETDANSHTLAWTYDELGRLTKVTAADLKETSYGYDNLDNLTSRTDAKQHATLHGYNADHELTSVTTPLGKKWTYDHDPDGNLVSKTDANGNATTADPNDGKTTFTYDNLDRLTGIDYVDTTPDVALAYNGFGDRTAMTDGAGTETYTYNGAGDVSSITRGLDTLAFAYDDAGNVTRRTYPDTTVADYAFDDDGRLASVTSGGKLTQYGYDPAGNLLTTTLPTANGYVESRAYDRAGWLSQVKNVKGTTVLSQYDLTRDNVGNPTRVDRSGSIGAATETYKYDPADRITEACFKASCTKNNDPYVRWAYDGVGNRLTETRSNGTTTYTYDADDRLTQRTGLGGSVTYAYDDNGQQIGAGSRTFTWDLAGRLKSTTSGATTVAYGYDGDGKRLSATVGTTTTKYFWDPSFALPELLLERDASGGLIRRYLHGNDTIAMTTPAGDFYYHHDHTGSVTNLTSSTGATQWTYAYEPFGAKRTETKNSPSAPANPLQYTGQYLDTTSALYHLRARDYDPVSGRFTTTDPLAPAITDPYVGAYAYANQQPTVLADASGLFWDDIGGGIATGWHTATSAADAAWDAGSSAAGAAWSATQTVASTTWHYTQAAAGVTYDAGRWLVDATVDAVVAPFVDAYHCVSALAGHDFRTAGRACIKAAIDIAAIAVGYGVGRLASPLLTAFGERVLAAIGEREFVAAATRGLTRLASGGRAAVTLGARSARRVRASRAAPRVAAEAGATARAASRSFGSGRPAHSAQVTVMREGQTIVDAPLRSGGMTPEEAALGFPKSTLATHTEARAVRQYPLRPGDVMTIRGQYPPCPSCKGAMNQAARSQGATIRYEWPGGSWTAGGRP